MALLRIHVTNERLSQLLYQPTTSTHPGYGFILLFPKAELRDAGNHPLASGTITVRLRPEAVLAPTLAMLERLLVPFSGFFALLVEGAATIGTPATSAEVVADSVFASNIQPT